MRANMTNPRSDPNATMTNGISEWTQKPIQDATIATSGMHKK